MSQSWCVAFLWAAWLGYSYLAYLFNVCWAWSLSAVDRLKNRELHIWSLSLNLACLSLSLVPDMHQRLLSKSVAVRVSLSVIACSLCTISWRVMKPQAHGRVLRSSQFPSLRASRDSDGSEWRTWMCSHTIVDGACLCFQLWKSFCGYESTCPTASTFSKLSRQQEATRLLHAISTESRWTSLWLLGDASLIDLG